MRPGQPRTAPAVGDASMVHLGAPTSTISEASTQEPRTPSAPDLLVPRPFSMSGTLAQER